MKPMEYIILSHRKNNFVCEFILGDRFLKKTAGSENYHFHSAHEVHVCVAGMMHVMVEDQMYELGEGELCVIAPGKVHYISFEKGACSMGFRFRFLSCGKEQSEENTLFSAAFCGPNNSFVVRGSGVLKKYISPASENLQKSGSSVITSSLLFLALYDLADRILGKGHRESIDESRYFDIALSEKIEHFVNSNYNSKTSLSDIAAYINLGNRQTERIIKKLFGMTYGDLLCQKWLAAAKLLLKTTTKTLDEIATACGFEDKSYFCRRFTVLFGISPGKYRRAFGNSHP